MSNQHPNPFRSQPPSQSQSSYYQSPIQPQPTRKGSDQSLLSANGGGGFGQSSNMMPGGGYQYAQPGSGSGIQGLSRSSSPSGDSTGTGSESGNGLMGGQYSGGRNGGAGGVSPRFGPSATTAYAPLSSQSHIQSPYGHPSQNGSYISSNGSYNGNANGRGSPSPSHSRSHSPQPQSHLAPSSNGHGNGNQNASINSRGGYARAATGAGGTGAGLGLGMGMGMGMGLGMGLGMAGDGGPRSRAGSEASHAGGGSPVASIAEKFSLSADPNAWGAETSPAFAEDDDYLHNPDPKRDRKFDRGGTIFTGRGFVNVGCIAVLIFALLMIFAGYPILTAYLPSHSSTLGAYNLGGTNSTGQVAALSTSLIDKDTPSSAYTHTSLDSGDTWELVFSDEFNTEGRTFYEGDDPYWQAENLHYWSTNNLEWYDPRSLTTADGSLVVQLTDLPNHGLNYTGGLMSSWNKFCYRGGYLEANVSLPGKSSVYGLWPAVWTLGNLGRAGYGGTLESMWPYSYNSCDVGTLSNQTLNGLPEIALTSGDDWAPYNGTLSYLEGQRLSACTCPNDASHPGPRNSDGTFVGRSAPEIDMFEAQTDNSALIGEVSQSAQWAPFNPYYTWINNSDTYFFNDPDVTKLNSYQGGVYQQATSGVSNTDQDCYQYGTGCFSVYGFEYASGEDGYVRWVNNGVESWMIRGQAMGANTEAEVGARPVPYEPMYMIINLGMSENFGAIDYEGLADLWPVHMRVDYIRLYQDPNNKMIGCDPVDMPTASYIDLYADAYNNPNITTFDQIGSGPGRPLNRLIDTC